MKHMLLLAGVGLAVICVGAGFGQTPDSSATQQVEALARVEIGNKWGFIDQTGKVVIPVQFEFALDFSEGLASVTFGGKAGFIDKTGKMVIPAQFEGAAPSTNNELWLISVANRASLTRVGRSSRNSTTSLRIFLKG